MHAVMFRHAAEMYTNVIQETGKTVTLISPIKVEKPRLNFCSTFNKNRYRIVSLEVV